MKIDDFFLSTGDDWLPMLNWDVINELPQFKDMEGVMQHTHWHKEGDVMTHTKNSIGALYDFFNQHPYLHLSKELVLGTLLHDVGKPATTKLNSEGEYSAKNHGPVGARIVREILKDEPDIRRREHVCALVRDHMVLHHIFDNEDVIKSNLVKLNHTYAPSSEFLYLNYADDFGSENDQTKAERYARLRNIDNVFEKHKMCNVKSYKKCVDKLSDYYNADKGECVEDNMFGVVIMVGYPGAGKDYFIEKNLPDMPTVSRDRVRINLGIMDEDKKGIGNKEQEEQVTDVCNTLIKHYCENRHSFVINNTSLPMYRRREIIEKLLPYNPYITIIFVDTPLDICKARRKGEIPDHVYERMISTFDFPMPYEANRIVRVTMDGECSVLWDDSEKSGGTRFCGWVRPFEKRSFKKWFIKNVLKCLNALRKI